MRYEAQTSLSPRQVYARARDYFGPAGPVGLAVTEDGPRRLVFAGGGGYVIVEAARSLDRTRVALEAWEFDREAREFLGSLPRPSGPFRSLWRRLRTR